MEFPGAALSSPSQHHWRIFLKIFSSLWEPAGVPGGKACKRVGTPYDYSPQGLHILILVHTCPIAICQIFWFNVPTGLYDITQLLAQLSKCLGSVSYRLLTLFRLRMARCLVISIFWGFIKYHFAWPALVRAEASFFPPSPLHVSTQTRSLLCYLKNLNFWKIL